MRRLLVLALLLTACNQDFDPADRRAALQDEYELRDQTCEVAAALESSDQFAGVAQATGTLFNRTDDAEGFGVVVRFFDGDLDLGNTSVNHPELIEPGESWAWEAGGVELDRRPTELRCDVIQVAIGQDVDH
jgi:hypothetical protein